MKEIIFLQSQKPIDTTRFYVISNRVLILFFTILFSLNSFSQKKSRADKFFEKGDYITAAKYYETDLFSKQHKKDLENISICYYNTFEYREALRNLKDLVNGRFYEKDKKIDNQFNFKIYQVLSALGNYEKGLEYLKAYNENKNDSLNIDDAVAEIENIKLKIPDYKIEKGKFNSDASDFGATKVGDKVYFTSNRVLKRKLFQNTYKWTHKPFLDIFSIKVTNENTPIGDIEELEGNLNTKLHEGNFCFSNDGNTLYVSQSNYKDGKREFNADKNNNIHLYQSKKVNGKWSTLKKLAFNKNGNSYQHPALSNDGKKLYFSSDASGGFGSFDLYYVDVDVNSFGKPINLGKTINTPNREHFPFISEKGNLFFSSNGHLGLGMLDNFVSEVIDNEFAKPINLGVPINSKYDDFNLNYYNETDGFFASNRNRINDDIFSFEQIGEIFLRKYENKFIFKDAFTKEELPSVNWNLFNKNEPVIKKTNTVQLFPGKYKVTAELKDYLNKEVNIRVWEKGNQEHIIYLRKVKIDKPIVEVEKPKDIKNTDLELLANNLKVDDENRTALLADTIGPAVIERDGKLFFDLKPIYFDFDMWNIRADSKLVLDELAEKLERYPNVHLKISSHTDSRGTSSYNQILSERRAESTRNYLALEGFINARRFKFEGFGENQLMIPCSNKCTDAEHQLNRRSEFEIMEY